MKDDDARRIDVNHCVRDSEIEEIERLVEEADPGEWRYNVDKDRLERRNGKPFTQVAGSLYLAAASARIIPRLLKGIRVLEQAYATVRAEAASWKNTACKARDDALAATLARSEGKTGPEWEPAQIARFAEVWAALPKESRHSNRNIGDAIAKLFRRWLGGESVGEEVRADIEGMQRELDLHRRFLAARDAELLDLRTRLRDHVARLDAGEVPSEVAEQWARASKESRKRILAEAKAAKEKAAAP